MKVVQINPVCYASTGKIAVEISKLMTSDGIENYILYTFGQSDYPHAIKYATDFQIKKNALFSKILGNYGFNSKRITKKLIEKLEEIKPDVIQLHNLHGHNVNLKMLFTYLKKIDVKIVWTFHDCWSFTGYCMYFDYADCSKWETECKDCCQKKQFSWFFDKSSLLYQRKKELFTGLKDMTIVTPSEWLSSLVKQSFFKEYPVKVIYNGIDLNVFRPMKSDIRNRYGLEGKKVLLGVAMGFGERKGFRYYLELAKMIDEDTRIVLVGVSKEQIAALPDNIIGIERTANQTELAQLYTTADVFVNCTMEEVLGMVSIESMACGTPVVTFNTGGSPECVDEMTGKVVNQGDLNSVLLCIEELLEKKNIGKYCRQRAEDNFDAKRGFQKYIELYRS